jgi:hypothetical protein
MSGASACSRWAVIAAMVLCIGCATHTDKIDASFVPTEKDGFIYGRMEFVVNGRTLPPDARAGLVTAEIVSHVSHFGGVETLNSNAWKPGEFFFRAPVSNHGEFAARLPVGRYYIVELIYLGAARGPAAMTAWRTYTEILGGDLFKPIVITFDVLPGKATYLGTIRHLVRLDPQRAGQQFFFGLDFIDEFGSSTEFMLREFPGLANATAQRAFEVETLSAPLKAR